MRSRIVCFSVLFWVRRACPWSPVHLGQIPMPMNRVSSVGRLNAEKEESGSGEENIVKRLWSGARRRISSPRSEKEENPIKEDEVKKEENLAMYAELEQRKRSMGSKEALADKSIYDALAKKADFPRISKKLNEALANRSLEVEENAPLDVTVLNDFVPSTGQSPGEVITGVLRALRDDGIAPEEGAFECRGVETLLKFMSPASELGGPDADPVSIATFFSNSEYNVLLTWNDIVFDTPLRLSTDSTKAYQTTRLKNAKTGQWSKVKWSLSLQPYGGNDSFSDFWLIDSMTIGRR